VQSAGIDPVFNSSDLRWCQASGQAVQVQDILNYTALYSGEAGILVSPVQVAVAASTLSNNGRVVTPQIAMAYKKPEDDWSLIDIGAEPLVIPDFEAGMAVDMLTHGNFPGWELSSFATYQEAKIAWYIAGTPANWLGTPVTLVIALEDGSALDARRIGRELFLETTATLE